MPILTPKHTATHAYPTQLLNARSATKNSTKTQYTATGETVISATHTAVEPSIHTARPSGPQRYISTMP